VHADLEADEQELQRRSPGAAHVQEGDAPPRRRSTSLGSSVSTLVTDSEGPPIQCEHHSLLNGMELVLGWNPVSTSL
jgi:hypothetical protein